jgi:hypothetical protein
LLPCSIVLWARRLVPVIKIVTEFTIGHSITLSLATLNVVVIPLTIVEPAIAASIVYVAIENFFGQVAIISIVAQPLSDLDRLMAVDKTKPARAATLVHAPSALIAVLGSYRFLTRALDSWWRPSMH